MNKTTVVVASGLAVFLSFSLNVKADTGAFGLPATMCWKQSGSATVKNNNSVCNASTTTTLKLNCPGINNWWGTIDTASQILSDSQSVSLETSGYSAASCVFRSSSKFGTYLFYATATGNSLSPQRVTKNQNLYNAKSGVFGMTCSLPRKQNGNGSCLYSYGFDVDYN